MDEANPTYQQMELFSRFQWMKVFTIYAYQIDDVIYTCQRMSLFMLWIGKFSFIKYSCRSQAATKTKHTQIFYAKQVENFRRCSIFSIPLQRQKLNNTKN